MVLRRAPFARRACILLADDTGTRWVRTSHFGAHVRGEGARISWATIHARVIEIGWLHVGEQEQRQPGGPGKRKAHIYEVPAGWDQ